MIALAAAAVLLAANPTPPPVLIGGGVLPDDRAWSVTRPSRGAHAAVVRRAATVPPKWRAFASCVLARESGATLDDPWSGAGARNPTSSGSGRWQLLDRQWRVNGGIHWIVGRRLLAVGMPRPQVKVVRQYLHRTPIHQWAPYWQDAAFIQIVTEGGAHHWAGPGCAVPR